MADTSIVRISGRKAIALAEAHGLELSMYTSPIEEGRDGLSLAEAQDVASEDPSLIYIDVPQGMFDEE